LVGDTDGFNFAAPSNNDIKYVAKGSHWKTNDGGKELVGIYAALAEFNEIYGRSYGFRPR
jgi:hypothetical protein